MTLIGAGFRDLPQAACHFGGAHANAKYISQEEMHCNVPTALDAGIAEEVLIGFDLPLDAGVLLLADTHVQDGVLQLTSQELFVVGGILMPSTHLPLHFFDLR